MITLKFVLWLLFLLFCLTSAVFVVWSKALVKRARKKLQSLDTTTVQEWNPAFLQAKRQKSDPLADQLVSSIMAQKELGHVNHLFTLITKDSDRLGADAPPALREYFETTSRLPEWADPDLLRLGQQVYLRHSLWISTLLCYKSLPVCYACANGAEVLHRTARLNKKEGSTNAFARRIAETAKFVMFSMSPGGLSPRGKGLVAAQKTRLIHAVIRHYIHQTEWDSEKYGQPINQQDLAGTLMSFSALILEGLETLGIVLDELEKEAYIHSWRIIGHLVGLDDDLLPHNSADALKLGYAILDLQKSESTQGTDLMAALLDFQYQKSAPLLSKDTNLALFRLVLGKENAEVLNVPAIEEQKVNRLQKRIQSVAFTMEKLDKSLVFAMVLQWFSKVSIHLFLNRLSGRSIIMFYLPKSLTEDTP